MGPSESSDGSDPEEQHQHESIEKPTPPDSLPSYLVDPLSRQSLSRLQDTADFVEELIEYQEQVEERKIDNPDAVPEDSEAVIEDGQRVWYNEELRSCNDGSCKCSSGNEDDLHGPYKYKYYRGDDGKMKSDYIGPVDNDE